MKVEDVICAAGRSGYMHRDLLAIKAGKAKPNGSLYEGEPMSPGFTRIIEPATIISVMLVLEDGQIAFGELFSMNKETLAAATLGCCYFESRGQSEIGETPMAGVSSLLSL